MGRKKKRKINYFKRFFSRRFTKKFLFYFFPCCWNFPRRVHPSPPLHSCSLSPPLLPVGPSKFFLLVGKEKKCKRRLKVFFFFFARLPFLFFCHVVFYLSEMLRGEVVAAWGAGVRVRKPFGMTTCLFYFIHCLSCQKSTETNGGGGRKKRRFIF